MNIHRLVEGFIRETGLSPTKFGRLAAGDQRLVFDLRKGREPGDKMVIRLRAFMENYRAGNHRNERIAA